MAMSLEQRPGSSWRSRRPLDDLVLDLKDLKESRYLDRNEIKGSRYYYRLASESSRSSDDGTESVYSVQDKDTDFVRDTSDTESKTSRRSSLSYDLEVEYEVASLSDDSITEISTSDSEDMMLAAAAAVICDNSLDVRVTDVEESDTSSEDTSFGRTDFSYCVQCKDKNVNPQYRYCEKCFQNCRRCNKRKTMKCFLFCQSCYEDRKKHFPPRPRKTKKTKARKIAEPIESSELGNCLKNLSQDSGIGSSQDFLSFDLDQIVLPAKEEKSESGTSQTRQDTIITKDSNLTKRKRQSSESGLSDYEVKKPKLSASDELFTSESSLSVKLYAANGDLCMFCNSAPKDSMFLHANIGHCCCCYVCAKKTLKTIKRCPICNLSVNKVVKVFTN